MIQVTSATPITAAPYLDIRATAWANGTWKLVPRASFMPLMKALYGQSPEVVRRFRGGTPSAPEGNAGERFAKVRALHVGHEQVAVGRLLQVPGLFGDVDSLFRGGELRLTRSFEFTHEGAGSLGFPGREW